MAGMKVTLSHSSMTMFSYREDGALDIIHSRQLV